MAMEPRMVVLIYMQHLKVFVVPRIEFAETVFATQLPHESRTEAAHGFTG